MLLNLVKPDLKNLDEKNIDEMLVKALIVVLHILLGGFTLKG